MSASRSLVRAATLIHVVGLGLYFLTALFIVQPTIVFAAFLFAHPAGPLLVSHLVLRKPLIRVISGLALIATNFWMLFSFSKSDSSTRPLIFLVVPICAYGVPIVLALVESFYNRRRPNASTQDANT